MSEKLTKYLTPVVALFFATALGVTAATTVGTDIVTDGNLTVNGTVTFSSADLLSLPVSVESGSGTTFDTGGDGSNWEFTASGGGNIIFNPGTGETTLQGRVRFVPQTSDPTTCDAGTRGSVGYANVDDQLCFCNGVSWVWVASTTVSCTFNAQ